MRKKHIQIDAFLQIQNVFAEYKKTGHRNTSITYHKNVANSDPGNADIRKFLHNVHQGCHGESIHIVWHCVIRKTIHSLKYT